MARLKTILIITTAVMGAFVIFAWNRPLISRFASAPHSVTLSWKGVPGANFYCVYRAQSGAQYRRIGRSSTTSYKDAPVPSKAVFYYAVSAVNDSGESKYSNQIKVVIP